MHVTHVRPTSTAPAPRGRHVVWVCRLAVVLAFAQLLIACGSTQAGGLTITGSTSVTPFAEHLAEIYQKQHPGAIINIQGLGSSAGIRAAIDGVAEIGMSSRDLEADETAALDEVVIARDALAIIVHPSNPITNLSEEQIQQIFDGHIKSWDAIGGASQPITLVSREAGSGTFGAFEELVMAGIPITDAALRQGSNGAIRQIVSEDPNAIGYISLGIVDASVKPLSIDGITPAVEQVEAGTYTLVRPFLFIWQKDHQLSPLAQGFVDYVMSAEGQAELAASGLVKGKQAQ